MSDLAPILDYANPLPGQPMTSDIVVEPRPDGFAFVVPPRGLRRGWISLVAAGVIAGLMAFAGVAIVVEFVRKPGDWAIVPLCFIAGGIVALLLWARLHYLTSIHPVVIIVQDGALLWHRPTIRGMRWRRWPRGTVRRVRATAAGRSVTFKALANLHVHGPWLYPRLLQLRDHAEMRWLADCLTRLLTAS